jgi:hypothetical protein
MKMLHVLYVALLMTAPTLSLAAGPQLVGTFSGTAKINTYNVAGTLTKTKVPMTIEIAQDDSTTLTLDTLVATNPNAVFSDANGLLLEVGSTFRLVTFQVKNTTMKGFIQGVNFPDAPGQTTLEGKFKLKKAQ